MASQDDVDTVSPLGGVHTFIVNCLGAVGVAEKDAEAMADMLVAADYRGHFSHGLNRLDMYVDTIEAGRCAVNAAPEVVNQTVATALVDGKNALGAVVGRFCMDLAVEKAKEAGIGWVSARGSNHFGIAAFHGLRAMEQGFLGMAFTNSSPHLIPTRGKTPTLGTNPICVAAPANNNDSFVLDMATTSVALGKVELAKRKGQSVPLGWGMDSQGHPTTDPLQVKGLSPLGGPEETSGYKGYGLATMVEIFCGILSGANYGPHCKSYRTNDRDANLGQCFVAIDPDVFAPGFKDRMSDLIDLCRNLEPAEGESEVLVAGDAEKLHMAKCDALGGIPYHTNQVEFVNKLAARLKVEPIPTQPPNTRKE